VVVPELAADLPCPGTGYSIVKNGVLCLPALAGRIDQHKWSRLAVRRSCEKGIFHRQGKRTLIYSGAPAMAASLWLAAQAENAEAAVGLITLTILLAGLNFPAFWSLPMDMNVQKAGFITGMMNTGSALASIVAPV